MNRREFLQSIGIASVAYAMPKITIAHTSALDWALAQSPPTVESVAIIRAYVTYNQNLKREKRLIDWAVTKGDCLSIPGFMDKVKAYKLS